MIKKRFYVVGLFLVLLSLSACSKHADLDEILQPCYHG